MRVELLHHTPLWVCAKAIRKCWASEDKSDTTANMIEGWDYNYDHTNELLSYGKEKEAGEKDKELIERIGNKNKHGSTLEHLNYTFDIDGISRACLQELARHRIASLSVKSTRYTLKELKDARTGDDIATFMVFTGNSKVDEIAYEQLLEIQKVMLSGGTNDQIKYMLPEAYKTSLVWTINARSLQNLLSLRTSKSALWEIRDLANELYQQLPKEHKYLFEEYVNV